MKAEGEEYDGVVEAEEEEAQREDAEHRQEEAMKDAKELRDAKKLMIDAKEQYGDLCRL